MRQGRVRGGYIDSAGVIRTFYEIGENKELPIPNKFPGGSKRDAMHRFEQSKRIATSTG